jgi:quercetin dioxygenase-like cupin family protein
MGGAPTVGSFDAQPAEEAFPGVARQSFSSERATVTRYRFEAGASFPRHSHDQEQVTLVLEGTVEMALAHERITLESGGFCVVPGGVEHGITAMDGGADILAVVMPPRERSDEYELTEAGR